MASASAFSEALALTEKDPSVATQLLLGLISEASQGRDISSAARELVVVSLSHHPDLDLNGEEDFVKTATWATE